MEEFQSRCLKPEQILGGGKSKASYVLENADWGTCFRKWQVLSGKNFTKWACVVPMRDEAITKEFIASLLKVSPSLGFKISNPKMMMLPDNRPASYIKELDAVCKMEPQVINSIS